MTVVGVNPVQASLFGSPLLQHERCAALRNVGANYRRHAAGISYTRAGGADESFSGAIVLERDVRRAPFLTSPRPINRPTGHSLFCLSDCRGY